jgi:hypothetical protein
MTGNGAACRHLSANRSESDSYADRCPRDATLAWAQQQGNEHTAPVPEPSLLSGRRRLSRPSTADFRDVGRARHRFPGDEDPDTPNQTRRRSELLDGNPVLPLCWPVERPEVLHGSRLLVGKGTSHRRPNEERRTQHEKWKGQALHGSIHRRHGGSRNAYGCGCVSSPGPRSVASHFQQSATESASSDRAILA